MKTTLQLIRPLVLASACAALLAGMPAGAQTVNPGVFVSSPDGTVTVYQRKSEGSYGVYDGQVRWVKGKREWNGRMLASATSERHGISLMDPVTHGVVVQMNNSGQPAYSFNPPLAYDWPLTVGKTWTTVAEMTTYLPPNMVSLTVNYKVEAWEDVTVPAGTFKAFKIVSTNSFGETEQVWTVPSLGLSSAKVIRERSAQHPLGPGRQEGVLLSRTVPPEG
jgi:hypothetical protein